MMTPPWVGGVGLRGGFTGRGILLMVRILISFSQCNTKSNIEG